MPFLRLYFLVFINFRNFNLSFIGPFSPQHLVLLEGVKIIPETFCKGGEVTLPNSITHIGGLAFYGMCTFSTPFHLPDSAIYMGRRIPIETGGHYNEWWHAHNKNDLEIEHVSGVQMPISESKFVFPKKLKYYNSMYAWKKYASSTYSLKDVCHVFTSDTIVVGEECDTLYAKLKAKVAYFYNREPVKMLSLGDLTVDTLYIPDGCMEAYRGKYGSSVKKIKELKAVQGIEFPADKLKMYIGDDLKMAVQIIPSEATEQRVYWACNNPEIATVSDGGIVHAKAYGTAEITVTTLDGGFKASCLVNVYNHTSGIEMEDRVSLYIDNVYQLNAKTLPQSTSDGEVTYTSGNDDIAIVNSLGVVTAKKKGICTITATTVDGGFTATCEVTVTQPVEALTLEKHSTSLKVGDSETLYAQIIPVTADNKNINWSSLDELIASVDESGIVTALKAGKATIKAESVDNPEAYDICEVTVIQPVLGVSLSHDKVTLDNEESIQLTASIEPDDASNKNVHWSCSNENVCVINNGLVTAIAPGQATITVTTDDGEYTANCIVKVIQHVTTVEMNKATLSLKVGEVERLSATVLPDNADEKMVNWSSSDEQVAIVDDKGNVTALKGGVVDIKAESVDNPEAFDICKVTVLQPATGISLNMQKCTLTEIGESAELVAIVAPEDASNKNVKWKSTDESVCIVANGTVVAVGSGVCVIIATSEDGGHMATCTVTVSIYDGVKGVEGAESVTIESISDAAGRRINTLQRGINILRISDGTTKKVVVRSATK